MLREGAGRPATRFALAVLATVSGQTKDVFIKTKRGFWPHQLLIGHKPLARFSPKLRFADLVVMAGWLHPFPFRTRP